MVDQLGADLGAEAGDHVEDAVGNAGFLGQRREFQRAGRGEFRRLDDDGATGGKRRGAFPGHEQQRRIPGRERRDDADRLMRGVGKGVRLVDRHQAAFELVDEAAEIPPPLRMIAQLAQHLGHQLAVVAHLDLGETLGIGGDEVAELAHRLAARGRRHLRPRAAPHRLIGGFHGLVGIGLGAARNLRPGFAAIGIDRIEPLAIGGIDILAVDVELIGFHVYPPIETRDGTSGPIPTFVHSSRQAAFANVEIRRTTSKILDSSGALDLTFALRIRGKKDSERQIRSTRWRDDIPVTSCAQARIRTPGMTKAALSSRSK